MTTLDDDTKITSPVVDLDQTQHIYDNRYKFWSAKFLPYLNSL